MSNKNFLITLIVTLIGLIAFLGGYLISQNRSDFAQQNFRQQASISNLSRFSGSSQISRETMSKQITNNFDQLTRLSTVKVTAPTISEDGKKVLYFQKDSGEILATDLVTQNSSIILGNLLPGLISAEWNKNGTEVITNQTGKGKNYFNLKTGETTHLNANMSSMAWSKNSQKIAYLFYDQKTGEGQISVSDPDGSVFKNILPTRAENLKIAWATNNLLSFYNPSGDDRSVFLLNMETKQLNKIIDSLDGIKILWSPDGAKLFYSYKEAGLIKAAILNLADQTTTTMDLRTRADKCTWTLNSFYLYCGGKKESDLSEKLYQLDINKKEFGLIFESTSMEPLEFSQLVLSPTENTLFFINSFDNYLYKINLEK